ncbi:MAG: bacterial transcriptional activator domain-containing protein, partial [Candidatus Eremiobacterota bacterium]
KEPQPAAAVLTLPVLRLYSLGPFEVYRGEERVDERSWKSQKVRYLLACIASHRGRPVQDDVLIDIFWPDDAVKGKINLYSAASYLKSNLRPSNWKGDVDYVVRMRGGLMLNPDRPRWHDYEEFETLFQQGRELEGQGQAEKAHELYRKLVRLYRGPYLDGCYMDWAGFIRTRLEQQMLEALGSLSASAAALQRHEEAREYSSKLLEIDPCHQNAHLTVMNSLIALGRPEEAVRQFEACRRALRSELDMEPSIDLLRAYQQAQLNVSVPPTVNKA